MTRRHRERNWPVLPIPLFLFEDVCYELARDTWAGDDAMPPFLVRDLGVLQGALAQPYQVFGGVEVYGDVLAKAACLFRGLIKDHPLVDGNKRAAVTATGVFLIVNGYLMTASNDQIRDYALRVARREGDYPIMAIRRWFSRHTRVRPVGEVAARRTYNQSVYNVGDPIAAWFPRSPESL